MPLNVPIEEEPLLSPAPSVYLDAEDVNQENLNLTITSIDSMIEGETHNLNCA